MLLEMMCRAELNRRPISLYTNQANTNKFEVGYLVGFDHDNFILERVSQEGKRDGYLFGRTPLIYRIERDTIYLRKILKLMAFNGFEKHDICFDQKDLLSNFIEFAYKEQKIMSVELFDSNNQDIIGTVSEFTSEFCTVNQISEYGEPDGYSTFRLEDISYIVYHSEEQKLIEVLQAEH